MQVGCQGWSQPDKVQQKIGLPYKSNDSQELTIGNNWRRVLTTPILQAPKMQAVYCILNSILVSCEFALTKWI